MESGLESDLEKGEDSCSSHNKTNDCETTDIESTSSQATKSSSESAVSLLSRLRSPTASDLSRNRKIKQNLPPIQKRGKGRVIPDPKILHQLNESGHSYPNEHFMVNHINRLFCSACCEELATKKSVIELHIKSLKHKWGKQRLARKGQQEVSIIEALKLFDHECHPAGETLPDTTRVYQVKVVTAMLKAGVALVRLTASGTYLRRMDLP